jgi:transposase
MGWKGLLELMEQVRTRVAREVGRPVEMISCYEAGYDGFWLHRLLERQGVRSHVIDPARCRWIGGHDEPRRITLMPRGCCDH